MASKPLQYPYGNMCMFCGSYGNDLLEEVRTKRRTVYYFHSECLHKENKKNKKARNK